MQVKPGLPADDAVDRSAQLLLDTYQMLRTLADNDRLLRITLHIDGYDHLRLAVIGHATLVVFRILDGIHDHGQRMRQLVVQLLKERATHQFGDGVFRTFLGNLLGGVHLWAFRHVLHKHVPDFGQIVVFQRTDRHDIGEISEFVDFDEFVDQPFTRKLVDFGDDGDQRHLPLERAVIALRREFGTQSAEDTLIAGADLLISRQQERDGIHVCQGLVDHVIETLAEQRTGSMNARGIHQHDLRVIGGENASNSLTRGFRTG